MTQEAMLFPRPLSSRLATRVGLAGLALLLSLLFLLAHVLGQLAQAATQPDLAFPFSPGESWRITCGYADGDGCQHPNNDWNRYALDLQHVDGGAATQGKPVKASASGTVQIAGWGGADSFGWYVTIDHGGGYSTIYAHMESDPPVSEGQQVSQGDVLGYAGCTGYCTGPHIHFVLMHDGASVKPEPICGQTGLNDGQVHTGCTLQPPVPPGSAGDPNCDGFVNSLDAQLVLQYEGGLTAGMGCPAAADVNGDGAATVVDATIILQYNAGLISGFPP